MFEHVPPEIFARIFEIGIEAWGIRFLPPLCLVCHCWNDLVISTPRLWSVITVDQSTRLWKIDFQIAKAKASPLTVIVSRDLCLRPSAPLELQLVLGQLASLAHNWSRADVDTRVLSITRWADMRWRLEDLRLVHENDTSDLDADAYFGPQDDIFPLPPKLHSFAADGVSKAWITRFLSPSITCLEMFNLAQTLDATIEYLSQTPNIITLNLNHVHHTMTEVPPSQPVDVPHLASLGLIDVGLTARLLCLIQAPSLQVLTICNGIYLWNVPAIVGTFMSSFFSQWSQDSYTPTHLHTLELYQCLQVGDVPYLIRWLARLPNIVRLILEDDVIGRAADSPSAIEGTNLFKALASPQGADATIEGWLCPSLMQLRLNTDEQVTDLIPIARARGGIATPLDPISGPHRLRLIEAYICPSGNYREIEELYSLMDEVRCACLGCEFKLDINA